MSRRSVVLIALVVAGLAMVVTYFLITVNTDRQITIGTGPVGSGSHTLALAVVEGLTAADSMRRSSPRSGRLTSSISSPILRIRSMSRSWQDLSMPVTIRPSSRSER